MVKIGAIWKQTKEDGTIYFKGRVDFPGQIIIGEGTDILLFKSKSQHEKAPYFDVLIAKPRPKQERASRSESDFDTTPPPDDDTPF